MTLTHWRGLTFEAVAKELGRDEVWVASAFYGQAKFSANDLQKVSGILDLPQADLDAALGDHWWPYRGLDPMPPTDPVLYRLYEGVLVYGNSIKVKVNFKFSEMTSPDESYAVYRL
ncbi:Cyanate hydratase [Marasmius crinis-equi]|uniref:Cyanate hydratase n=1 Tax=Marasmius crinis-equi TaxID=585013 RepID=A0ABR3FD49_9AGAR